MLEGIEQKYKSEEGVQLEILADHFITLFKDADIPFNKIVLDMPRSTVSLLDLVCKKSVQLVGRRDPN